MFKKFFGKKAVKITLVVIGIVVFEFCLCVFFSNYMKLKAYDSAVYPNTYLGDYTLANVEFGNLDHRVEFYTEGILNNKFVFVHGDDKYCYTFEELGLKVDKKKVIDDVISEQKNLNYFDKIKQLNGESTTVYKLRFTYDKDELLKFVNKLKENVDSAIINDKLVMSDNRELSYIAGKDGFVLDVDKTFELIVKTIDTELVGNVVLNLEGEVLPVVHNEQYKSIDTKVSEFTTEFNPYISRATNLRTALGYIDGAIIMPGEIFSFYNYAGPYNKQGYVFYYEFVGNGVCQIATTVYNAALLGGLEIVKRSPHAAKSVYVDGGLDATVASYASGWHVDFQFKNTYDYPIYISAYAVDGTAHVDFWSNHDAKRGKTYSTESVQIGYRGYTTYLHTYQDGIEISKDKIATTWYSKD